MIFECHGHIILNSVSYISAVERHKEGPNEAFIRQNLMTCSDNGIVFYRDGGDKHGVSLFAKSIAGEYGIDYRTPIYIIHKKGYYGSMFGRAYESTAGYYELVYEAKRLGADFIKLTASGLLDFLNGGRVTGPPMAEDELAESIKFAQGEGFAVMIHANGAENIKKALRAGADSIEHGYYIDREALLMMAEAGTVWVPTCVTAANLIGSGVYDDDMLKRIHDGHTSALSEAYTLGVLIACGSDAGASRVPQGIGTHDELAVLNSLGIDPEPVNKKIAEKFICNSPVC